MISFTEIITLFSKATRGIRRDTTLEVKNSGIIFVFCHYKNLIVELNIKWTNKGTRFVTDIESRLRIFSFIFQIYNSYWIHVITRKIYTLHDINSSPPTSNTITLFLLFLHKNILFPAKFYLILWFCSHVTTFILKCLSYYFLNSIVSGGRYKKMKREKPNIPEISKIYYCFF